LTISRFHLTTLGFDPNSVVDRRHKLLLGLWREVTGTTFIKKITISLIDKDRDLDIRK